MKRNKLTLLLLLAALVCALFALVGCNDTSGSFSGGGGSGDEPSGEDPLPRIITKVEYSYEIEPDTSALPLTVEAGERTMNHDSIPLKASVHAFVYSMADPNDPNPSVDSGPKPVDLTKNLSARIDWPIDVFETEKEFLPDLQIDPQEDWRRDFGKYISFDDKDLDRNSLLMDIITDSSLRDMIYGRDTEVVNTGTPTADFHLSFEDLFNVIPAKEHRAVTATVDANREESHRLAPFVENAFDRGEIVFTTVGGIDIGVTADMVNAAYPDGDVQARSTDRSPLVLLIDRLEYKATFSYGGITYDIDIPFTEYHNIDKDSYTISVEDRKMYGSPYLNWSDFYLDQFAEEELTIAIDVHSLLEDTEIEERVTFSLPVERSDIFACDPSEEAVTFYFNASMEYGPITFREIVFPCEQPTAYLFHMPDLHVAEVAKYDTGLFEKVPFVTADVLYSDSHVLSLTYEEIDNASYESEGFRDQNLLHYYEHYLYDLMQDYRELSASPAPYTLEAGQNKVTGLLKESIAYAVFTEEIEETMHLYRKQTFAPPMVSSITEYYYDSVRSCSDEPQQRTVALPEDFFAGFNTDKQGTTVKSLATEETIYPEQCGSFTLIVENDTVERLTFELSLLFGGIIVGEPVDLRDCYVIAHYTHGQTDRVPFTPDMLGSYDASRTGEQNIEVTYRDEEISFTDTVAMTVRKVKSFTVAEGLDKYYLDGEEPDFDVWIAVTYTDEEETDFVSIPPEKFASFNTTGAGSHSFALTYGGYTLTYSYEVIEGLYLTYTVGDHISFTGYRLGKPEQGEENVFVPEDIKNIVLPANIGGVPVTELKANLFANLSILRSLVVPDSVTTVGYGVVDNCKNLKTLTIPTTVPIEKYFKEYKEAKWPANGTNPTLPNDLTIVFSDSSTALSADFLKNFQSDSDTPIAFKIDFGAGIQSITIENESSPFPNWGYIQGFAATGNTAFTVTENVLFGNGGATLLYYPDFKTETSYTVPAGVTEIKYMENQNLTELVISKDVITLPEDFMSSCDKLQSVTFAAGSSLRVLPEDAFRSCSSLETFVFPENLEEIGAYALTYIKVEKIILPKTVTKIGDHAFDNATCTHFYLPTGATDSCLTPSMYYSTGIQLPKLQAFAYDGSVILSNLLFFVETNTYRAGFDLYITGEDTAIAGTDWYGGGFGNVFAGSATPLRSVHVFGGVSFNRGNLPGSVTVTNHADTAAKWW